MFPNVLSGAEYSYVPTVPEKIIEYSRSFNVDSVLAVNIAYAESNFDPSTKNSSSTAKGVFQILNGTWKDYKCIGNPLNADDNIRCAMKIMKQDGYGAWNASYEMNGYGWRYLPYKKKLAYH